MGVVDGPAQRAQRHLLITKESPSWTKGYILWLIVGAVVIWIYYHSKMGGGICIEFEDLYIITCRCGLCCTSETGRSVF